MSQSPYNPPNVPGYYASGFPYAMHDPFAQLRRPAKISGIAMIVFGSLLCVCGVTGVTMSFFPIEQILSQMPGAQEQLSQIMQDSGMSVGRMLLLNGISNTVMGLPVLVLGVFVRRGGTGWLIASLVVVLLLSLLLLVSAIGSLRAGPANACVGFVFVAAVVCIAVGLILALRNNGRIREMQRQMQMQMYAQQQYQQQQMQRANPRGQSPNPPTNPPTPQ